MRSQLVKYAASLLKISLRAALSYAPLRRRVAFEIASKYYEDLNVVVPLPGGILCPITTQEHWVSFHNIFCEREYDDLLKLIPLPNAWLDLGCHAGHFTLLLVSLWAQRAATPNWRALLIDADSRCETAINKITKYNRWGSAQIRFVHGAISELSGEIPFSEDLYMTSEIAANGSRGSRVRSVASIRERDILNRMTPPYDLIKLDIEGAEFDFLRAYSAVLMQAKYLIFEWHSWHRGGGGKAQLVDLAEQLRFRFVAECHSERVLKRNDRPEQCGLVLMDNEIRHERK